MVRVLKTELGRSVPMEQRLCSEGVKQAIKKGVWKRRARKIGIKDGPAKTIDTKKRREVLILMKVRMVRSRRKKNGAVEKMKKIMLL